VIAICTKVAAFSNPGNLSTKASSHGK
jgi:hypothetical protein